MQSHGDDVVRTEDAVEPGHDVLRDVDFIVSYGFRHIIPAAVLAPFGNSAVNLHISLLPWNRGADPNLWSFLESTPKGVTIHILDEGLDTGPVLVQREVAARDDDTLASSYERLTGAIEELFCEAWGDIRSCSIAPSPQTGAGSSHKAADKVPYEHLLIAGWDTPVTGLIGAALP